MTAIEWTDETWNPTVGCSRVSEGCRHCYAEQQAARIVRMSAADGRYTPYEGLVKVVPATAGMRGTEARWTGFVRILPDRLALPLRWRAPRQVFVNSMSDLFHETLTNEQIAAVFGVMAACPQHTFQVLTKRVRRMREWFEWAEKHGDGHDMLRFGPSALLTCAWEACSGDTWGDIEPSGVLESLPSADVFGTTWPLPNVWLGVSVENQDAADERIPELLATPAAVRFLSCEPLLGPVDLRHVQHDREFEVDALTGAHGVNRPLLGRGPRINWVIGGCESGPGARPCNIAWLRSLRDQCAEVGTPFFLKQATAGDGITMGPHSKRKPMNLISLPLLDGVEHAEFPKSGS